MYVCTRVSPPPRLTSPPNFAHALETCTCRQWGGRISRECAGSPLLGSTTRKISRRRERSDSFERPSAPVPCGLHASPSFPTLLMIQDFLLIKETLFQRLRFSPNSDCIAPNPTYAFPALSATRGVCRFLQKDARKARFSMRVEP